MMEFAENILLTQDFTINKKLQDVKVLLSKYIANTESRDFWDITDSVVTLQILQIISWKRQN